MGTYLGGATRVVVQPWRCLTRFVRFLICRSEPKKTQFVLKYYSHSDEMRRFKRRRFLRVVALLCLKFDFDFIKSQTSLFEANDFFFMNQHHHHHTQ
ncbi:hypothetical protein Hanom_Chr12g01125861 [Helianthus anomalus]